MQVFWEIAVSAVEMTVLVFAFLGLVLSLLLIFTRQYIRTVSRFWDQQINFDKKIGFLNRLIQTDRFAYRYHRWVGIAFIGGALFLLVFLYSRIDNIGFDNIVYGIIFNSSVLLGKIVGFSGILLGVLLAAFPEKVRQLEEKLGRWYDTQSLVERLNRSNTLVDALFHEHPLVFGIIGALASIFLIALSLVSLLH